MSADLLAGSIRGIVETIVRKLLPKTSVVGKVASIGASTFGGPLVATITGVLEGTLLVPQKSFSSWFLHEATTGNVTGLRVLVLFTEGDQPVLMTTLPPIGD